MSHALYRLGENRGAFRPSCAAGSAPENEIAPLFCGEPFKDQGSTPPPAAGLNVEGTLNKGEYRITNTEYRMSKDGILSFKH
jgi:hypothetical protein